MSGPFNSGFTYFLENNNLGRIGISLRCCIRALPVVCENKWPVLHISYMTDEPWRLPLWRWLLSQTVRLLILELYSSSFHPQKESILFEPNISKCRKCFLSLKLESYQAFSVPAEILLHDPFLYRHVNIIRPKLKLASFAIIVRIIAQDCKKGSPIISLYQHLTLAAPPSSIPLLAILNSWILNLIWLFISSMENTTNRLSGLFDFSMNGKSWRNCFIWVNKPR